MEGHISGRVRKESQHAVRATRKAHPGRDIAANKFEHQGTREFSCILKRLDSKKCGVRKYNCCTSAHSLEPDPSFVEAAMKIDKPVSEQIFRRGWRIQFDAG